ncbi:MAG: YhjD/YihY/BrkB family envelope integrity protein [Actinomycetota bacterium]
MRKRTLLERAARERERHESVRTLFHLFEEDKGRGGGLLAGGLAYRMFIWLLPAALVASSLMRLVAEVGGKSASTTAKELGMGAAVATSVNRAAVQAGRAAPFLLVAGLVIMVWASRGVLKALRLVSAIAWGMSPSPLRSPIRPTLATAGFLAAIPIYGIVVAPLYGGSLAGDIVATLLATTGIIAIATWAATSLPRPDDVGRFDLFPGAILFAVGIEALQLATTLYFAGKLERLDDLYGALGFAAVFMTYLYLVARLTVLGLMANAAVWRSGSPEGASTRHERAHRIG